MSDAPGCQLICDAWTKNTHFLAMYDSFMRHVDIIVGGEKVQTDDIHECQLIAASPMTALLDTNDENGNNHDGFDKKAVKFNMKHHMNYIKNNFEYYDKDADEFILCQCADSAAVNIKAARIMNMPHSSYKYHNCSLHCNKMVKMM